MTAMCRRLDIERYIGGELTTEQADELLSHCDSCSDCGSYLAQLQAERTDFLHKHPFSSFTRAHAPLVALPWYRTISIGTLRPVLATAGVALLVTLTVLPLMNGRNRRSPEPVRFKGAPSLTFIYQREGATSQGSVSMRFRAGDRIQVTCPPVHYSFVSLFSVDTRGTVSFYHPDYQAPYCSIPLTGGGPTVFPGSIELDDSPGAELVIALFSKDKLLTRAVEEWIRRLFTEVSDIESLQKRLHGEKNPFDAQTALLLLRKE